MAVFLIVLYLLFITPVGLGAAAAVGSGGRPEGAAAVMLWGFRMQVNAAIEKNEQGQYQFVTTFRKKARRTQPKTQLFSRVLRSVYRSHGLLRRVIRLRDLSLHADVGTMDAAAVALWTALLQSASAFTGDRVHITARPAYSRQGGLHVRCIVETRLGMLWTAGALGGRGLLTGRKKEEAAWNIPSET